MGEVSVQVDLYTHPGTGEHKVNVKGLAEGSIMFSRLTVLSPQLLPLTTSRWPSHSKG